MASGSGSGKNETVRMLSALVSILPPADCHWPLRTMNHWSITSPWVFFGFGGALVAYLLYTMVRRRKGERAGVGNREPEL